MQSNESISSDMKHDEMIETIVEFWSERNSLPAWRGLGHLCCILQSTSVSVEGAQSYSQLVALVDLIKTTLILPCNEAEIFE